MSNEQVKNIALDKIEKNAHSIENMLEMCK